MKKLNYTKINYKMSDCKIEDTFYSKKIKNVKRSISIIHNGEIVCQITNIENGIDPIPYIKCMFMNCKMYTKLCFSTLKKLFNDTVILDIYKKVESAIETVITVTIEVAERTRKVVKKWITSVKDKYKGSKSDYVINQFYFNNPFPNIRFNLR